jgi:hypothetical protein
MTPTAKLRVEARRAIGRRPGSAVELGAPATWPASELRRVREEAHRLARARARRSLPGVIGLVIVAEVALALLVLSLAEAVAVAVLGVLAWWLHTTFTELPVVAGWRTWAHDRRVLERELRLLGPEWRLLWDRRVHGLPAPAIVAVGPSGAWALWHPEPGLNRYADVEAAANAISELAGLPAGAYVLPETPQQIQGFVQEMVCAPRVASRDDVDRAAGTLHSMLLQEPVGVGL